ncbi:MAG TPA: peptide deformylase, partial [bacterium]|nr:peptide deformylase [bacterium]
KKKALPVEKIDEKIIDLIKDMVDTMKAAGGLGLAANQVGVLFRVVIIDFGYLEYDEALENGKEPDPPEFRPSALINPVIESKEGSTSIQEGCLSVPGYRCEVERASKITYSYTTTEGERKTAVAENLGAIAIQHEIDHINGILFIDRVSNLKRNIAIKKVKKYLDHIKENGDKIEGALYGKS